MSVAEVRLWGHMVGAVAVDRQADSVRRFRHHDEIHVEVSVHVARDDALRRSADADEHGGETDRRQGLWRRDETVSYGDENESEKERDAERHGGPRVVGLSVRTEVKALRPERGAIPGLPRLQRNGRSSTPAFLHRNA